ncbi:MAG: hypothetical protein QW666_02645 [Candidatus Woesearchaeota archaeon]
MMLDYIRNKALYALLGLSALVSPAILPGSISSIFAQEQKEESQKQESKSLQELLSEEVKRLEDKEKTPDEYIRLAELYIDQKELFNDEKAEPKLEKLLDAIKGKEGNEFEYVNLLVYEAITGKRKSYGIYITIFTEEGLPPKLESKFHSLYVTKCDDELDKINEHLQKAIELDPSNISAYLRLFEFAARSPVIARTLEEEYDFEKVADFIGMQKMYFDSALKIASKLELADCLRAKYRLLTAHSAFLEKAIECLTLDAIGVPHSKKYLDFRTKCVVECVDELELKLKILPTCEEYLFFISKSISFLRPNIKEFDKQVQFKIIDKIIPACDEALKNYSKKQNTLYWHKAFILSSKANLVVGQKAWEASKLNETAKKLCKECIENYELALKYETDTFMQKYLKECLEKEQKRLLGKKVK